MASDTLFESDYAVRMIKLSRQQPINFAFGFGGAGENALLADKVKTGPQLFALLKKEKFAKGFWGTLSSDGSVVTFSCVRQMSGQQKMLLEWLRAQKLSLKPAVVAAVDGEEGAEAEKEDAATNPTPPPSPADRRDTGATARKVQEEEDDEEEDEGETAQDEDEAPEEDESEEEEDDETLLQKIFTAAELKKNILYAKKKPVFFAFGRGEDAGSNLLALHRRQNGRKLVTLIKRENGATKGSFGTATTEGKIVTFQCEKAPLGGLKRMIRALLKERKLGFKVVVAGPDGVVEEEEDDATGTAAAPTSDTVGQDQETLARLREQFDALLPALKAAAKNPEWIGPIREKWRQGEAALKAGNTDGAEAAVGELEQLLARVGEVNEESSRETGTETAQPMDLPERWTQARDTLSDAGAQALKQLDALKGTLLGYDDDDLKTVANSGITGIAQTVETYLKGMLDPTDVEAGAPPAQYRKAAATALVTCTQALAFLNSDERIDGCDRNPFSVKVTLTTDFTAVITEFETVLRSAA